MSETINLAFSGIRYSGFFKMESDLGFFFTDDELIITKFKKSWVAKTAGLATGGGFGVASVAADIHAQEKKYSDLTKAEVLGWNKKSSIISYNDIKAINFPKNQKGFWYIEKEHEKIKFGLLKPLKGYERSEDFKSLSLKDRPQYMWNMIKKLEVLEGKMEQI